MEKKFEYSLCIDYPDTMTAEAFTLWLDKVKKRVIEFYTFLGKQGEICYVHFSDIISVNNYKDKE